GTWTGSSRRSRRSTWVRSLSGRTSNSGGVSEAPPMPPLRGAGTAGARSGPDTARVARSLSGERLDGIGGEPHGRAAGGLDGRAHAARPARLAVHRQAQPGRVRGRGLGLAE